MLKTISGLALMWLGMAGAVITLFANVLAPLDMADWAWWIVGNWQESTPAFWDLPAARIGLEVPSLLVPPLNIAAFLLLTAIGVRMRDHNSRVPAVVNVSSYHLIGGIVVLFTIGHIVVTGPSQSSSTGGAPVDVPLVIFLAAAAASFSPIAGRGNLIARLWCILAGLIILLALNELTRLGLDMMAPKEPN